MLAGLSWAVPFYGFLLVFPVLVVAYVSLPETRIPESEGDIAQAIRAYWVSLTSELMNPTFAVLVAGAFTIAVLKYAVLTFVPLYAVRVLGAPLFVAGLVISVRGVVRLLVAPLTGALVLRFSRPGVLFGGLVAGGFSVALIPISGTVIGLVAALVVYSGSDALFSTMLNDTVASTATTEHRGGVVSGINTMKNVGNSASPAVLGVLLAAGGFGIVFWAAAAVSIGYVAAAITVGRRFGSVL